MLCVAGIIMYVTALATIPSGVGVDFFMVSLLLGPLFFFIGTIAYNVCKYFPKTNSEVASYVQLATGLLSTIFLAIGARAIFANGALLDMMDAMHTIPNLDLAPAEGLARWYAFALVSTAYFGQLIVFGILPLFKGIQKTLAVTEAEWQRCCRKSEPVTVDQPKVAVQKEEIIPEIKFVNESEETEVEAKPKPTPKPKVKTTAAKPKAPAKPRATTTKK